MNRILDVGGLGALGGVRFDWGVHNGWLVEGVFCSFKNFVEMRKNCVSRGRRTAAGG
jgi:hypothetical protein